MTDAITHLEELIAHQPDGSPLTPKLQEVVTEIQRLQGEASTLVEVRAEHNEMRAAFSAAQGELTALRAEHEKLRALAGAVSNGPSQREIKQDLETE